MLPVIKPFKIILPVAVLHAFGLVELLPVIFGVGLTVTIASPGKD